MVYTWPCHSSQSATELREKHIAQVEDMGEKAIPGLPVSVNRQERCIAATILNAFHPHTYGDIHPYKPLMTLIAQHAALHPLQTDSADAKNDTSSFFLYSFIYGTVLSHTTLLQFLINPAFLSPSANIIASFQLPYGSHSYLHILHQSLHQ